MGQQVSRYECARCGEVLAIPRVRNRRVMIRTAISESNRRILLLGSEEIHACAVDYPRPMQTKERRLRLVLSAPR
jgi:hypothetical protein